jgi:glutamate carboxypeptidase
VVAGTQVSHDPALARGTAEGKTNVIAGQAVVDGDLRFLSNEQRENAKRRMQDIVAASLPGTHAQIEFHDSYPAMAPTEGNRALLAVFDQASRDLGQGPLPALDPGQRGAGDVSFVAPDVSALDGLGARGGGEHTPDEWIDLSAMPPLIKRAAILIYRLTR